MTNGWLKPKVLFEKTGVPAAHLLQEELSKIEGWMMMGEVSRAHGSLAAEAPSDPPAPC